MVAQDKILVTGANGFVGRHIVQRLLNDGYALRLAVRSAARKPALPARAENVSVGDISPETDWSKALQGCTTVVHLAALTPGRHTEDQLVSVNDRGTARLIHQAHEIGVQRFVLMSSIFALVDNSAEEVVDDRFAPLATSAYGRSKQAAEKHVAGFARAGRVGIALRPPLVCGPDAGGNWKLLLRLAASGLPLPFGLIENRRSLVGVETLADAVSAVISGPMETGLSGNYAVAEDGVASLRQLIVWLRRGMSKPARLVPVPPKLLEAGLNAAGRTTVARSLFGNLEVDARRFQVTFSWRPPMSLQDVIERSGKEFVCG